jgi:alginate O-acetyltransferase complex protein AlgI
LYGIEFGNWLFATGGGKWTVAWILVGFIVILLYENSSHKLDSFKLNYRTALFSGVAFGFGVLGLNNISEFLYFNF